MRDYKTKEDLAGFNPSRRVRRTDDVSNSGLIGSLIALIFVVIAWLFLFLIAVVATPAYGAETEPSRLWATPGAISYHFDRGQGYNERNLGVGFEYRMTNNTTLALGQYQNSVERLSRYALLGYTPWHPTERIKVGVMVGVASGYRDKGKLSPVLLPVLAIEFRHIGINLSFVPPIKDKVGGAVAIQFKFRF